MKDNRAELRGRSAARVSTTTQHYSPTQLRFVEMTESLSSLVQTWLQWDQDPKTRSEIEQLRDSNSTEELELRLRSRIVFGTAGLRGPVRAGCSGMCSLVVIQASQGLAKYIHTNRPEIRSKGVAIGYDARHDSRRFAELAANAFIALEIPVWFIGKPSPTPLVPFCINRLNLAGGVVVTASHNPPQDNGYKVYSSNGVQINRPEDGEIAQSILENLEPWPNAWSNLQPSEYLHADAYEKIILPYKHQVKEFAESTAREGQSLSPFVYTPLHGVGGLVLPDVCASLGVEDFVSVPLQHEPDPDFPTVKFPNPEEVGALDLAMETADQEGRNLIIANDPDADRFAAAEKVNGKWEIFTGDHVGVLLASHVLDAWTDRDDFDPFKMTVLTTAVSGTILQKLAAAKGVHFEETLTGFKWLGNKARELESVGRNVCFAYEEALGYMFPSICYDKDGITAAALFLVAVAEWRSEGLTVHGKLQSLFAKLGYHETLNNYFRSPNPELTSELFRGIRSGPFLAEKQFGRFKILRWRDLTEGYDSASSDNIPDLPQDPSSQMLTLWLEGGVRFTIRGSGTEPKVKFYIESCGASRDDAVQAVCDTFLTIQKEWVHRYTPTLTHSRQLPTSSGHILTVD